MEQIRVAIKEPRKPLVFKDIDNDLKTLQDKVDGWIEVVPFGDMVVICDEDGRLKGKEPNVKIGGIGFVGTIIIAGAGDEEFTSLPKKYR